LEKYLQQTVLNHEKAGSMVSLHEEQLVGLQMTHMQLQRNLRQCVGVKSRENSSLVQVHHGARNLADRDDDNGMMRDDARTFGDSVTTRIC